MNYGKRKDYDICHPSIEISALKIALPDIMCKKYLTLSHFRKNIRITGSIHDPIIMRVVKSIRVKSRRFETN